MLKNLHLLDDWTFCHGEGDPETKRACVMSAFSVLNGEEFSDVSSLRAPPDANNSQRN